ncbi:hypothetical protein F7725_024790 [Dissostichus mawsoni]|uniref:Uncharacterized protein n=1 Tax=Dissostichus mawsoni TaxID=36200 RepID=A0A7J5X9A3_DISMA|nr:hypothetical protein F7725_024790 [Dissostichus mawsoni]
MTVLQILPCSVSQLLSASKASSDTFALCDQEFNQVSVVGVVRELLPFVKYGERSLQAKHIRVITDPNEITSHMLEVVHAHMQIFKKKFDVNMNITAVPSEDLPSVQGQILVDVSDG